MSKVRHRVAFLQKAPSGHMDACLRKLADTGEVELFATIPATLPDAPFAASDRPWIDHQFPINGLGRNDQLVDALRCFDPSLVLVVGWEPPAYRRAARALRRSARRIVCMDHQFHGTLKQRAGILASGFYLKPYYDGAFVAGARQRSFARRLGFSEADIFDGLYSCDVDRFASVPNLDQSSLEDRRRFIWVGRLVDEKRVDMMADAYGRYRARADAPWELEVVGAGPLGELFDGHGGIDLAGFVQPADLPMLFSRAACHGAHRASPPAPMISTAFSTPATIDW